MSLFGKEATLHTHTINLHFPLRFWLWSINLNCSISMAACLGFNPLFFDAKFRDNVKIGSRGACTKPED